MPRPSGHFRHPPPTTRLPQTVAICPARVGVSTLPLENRVVHEWGEERRNPGNLEEPLSTETRFGELHTESPVTSDKTARMRSIAGSLWDRRDAGLVADLRDLLRQVAGPLARLARLREGRAAACSICSLVDVEDHRKASPAALSGSGLSRVRELVPPLGSPGYATCYVACPVCGLLYFYTFEWESNVEQAEPRETLLRPGLREQLDLVRREIKELGEAPPSGWTPSLLSSALDHIHAIVTIEAPATDTRRAKGSR